MSERAFIRSRNEPPESPPNPVASSSYPHLLPGEQSRGRLVRELQDEGWWSVAEDVAEGMPLATVYERVKGLGDGQAEYLVDTARGGDVE